MHTRLTRLTIGAASMLLTGCATIMHGTQQDVGLGSAVSRPPDSLGSHHASKGSVGDALELF
jgi:hypothetical protein